MIFLAQLNFADLPPLVDYPTHGLLSFFVRDEDLQGCKFPSIGDDGFRVIFQEETQSLTRRDVPEGMEYVPLSTRLAAEGRPLTGTAATCPISPNSYQGTELTEGWYPDCPNDLWDDFSEGLLQAKASQLYVGGHPDFVQQDFRSPGADPDYTPYTEVLFQMGFIPRGDNGIEVCWGDAGEATFLITKEDLAARRFDRIAYNWDCG